MPPTPQACESHLHDPLGSSKYFAPSVDFAGAYFASDDQAANPGAWGGAAHAPSHARPLTLTQTPPPAPPRPAAPSPRADMYDWNHVDVPYCSQDLHSGMRTAVSNATWGLYFAGHHVFTAIIDALVATAGLNDATGAWLGSGRRG